MTSDYREFVGRTAEIAVLRRAWRRARDDRQARLVAVRGPAGAGKTALVRAFLAEPGGPPAAVGVSADLAGFAQPWQVLAEVLRRLGAAGDEAAARWGPPDAFADPFLLATDLARLLRRPDGLLLVIDDAQLIDQQSLDALRYAVDRVTGSPLLVVLVYQPDEDPMRRLAGRAADPDRPQSWVAEVDPARTDVVDLGPLTVADLITLARARRRPLPTAAAVRLLELAEGNTVHALYLLTRFDLSTLTAAVTPLGAPRDVFRAVTAALAELPAEAQEVIMAAAVLGRRFSVADVRELHGGEVRAALAAAVDAGLLDEEPGSAGRRLRFVTTLVRDAAYEKLPATRRRELHRAAARLSVQHTVWHRVAASDGPDDDLAEAVARVARDQYREHHPHRAAQYMRQALELTPRDSPRRPARLFEAVEWLLVVGELGTAFEYAEAIAAAPPGPWKGYIEGYLTLVNAQPEEAREAFRAALELRPDDDLTARICVQIAVLGIVTLHYAEIADYASRAIALAPDDHTVTSFAWFARALGLAMTGRAGTALEQLARSNALLLSSGLDALVARGIVRLWTDDLAGAHADLADAVQRATRGESLRIGQALAYLAETEFRRGDLAAAVQVAHWAVEDAEANRRLWDFALVRAIACYPHAVRGEWAVAEELARDAQNAAWTAVGRAYAAGALVTLAQARDEPARLLDAADQLAAVLDIDEPGTHLFGPVRADALSRLGRVDEARRELAAFRERHGPLGRRSAMMAADRVKAQIAYAAGEHGRSCEPAFRALRAAVELDLPLEAGRIRLVAARCLRACGAPHAAERFLGEAMRAFRERGAEAYVAQAVALGGTTDRPDYGLTDNERRMLRMHLDGRPYRVIADDLHLGLKSVENRMRLIRHTKLQVQAVEDPRAVIEAALSEGD